MNGVKAIQSEMTAITDALVYAAAYISIASGDDDRQHDDCRALESISDILTRCTAAEREALHDASERAIAEASTAPPNIVLANAYRDFLGTLHELFPNDRHA